MQDALPCCPAESHPALISTGRVWKEVPGLGQRAGMRENPMPSEKGKWFCYFHSLDKTRAKSFPTTTARHCSAVVTVRDPLTALPGVDTKMEITESLWPEVN